MNDPKRVAGGRDLQIERGSGTHEREVRFELKRLAFRSSFTARFEEL